MFGMMNTTNTSIKGTSLTFVLITRRSRYRAGTRYFSRGIDERGNVSNFNETEQAVILNDDASSGLSSFAGHEGYEDSKPKGIGRETQVLSYVQTRGSVPVYWAEVNTLQYTPKLQIRGVESAVQAAKRHFDEQIRLYGDNYLVNLVNEKGRERRVKEAYEQIVKLLLSSPEEEIEADSRSREKFGTIEAQNSKQQFDRLHYIYFDFHNETKGLKWHRAQLLLDQLQPALEKQQYFHGVDAPDGRIDVRNQQTSVVRTNCMDCLDRTNVVQSMLGRWVLSRMLVDLGLLQPGQSAQDDAAFENVFRNVWADNADVVSKSYSGTGALKTDFTRTGNRTRAGMVQDVTNSVTRYIRNNFADGPRQDGFDLLLGTYVPDSGGMGSALHFVDRRPLVIQCVPYILAGCLFFVMTSLFTRRMPDATVWPLRILVLVCLAVAMWAGIFIRGHGALYVNWPKLNTPPWATEGYQDALDRVGRDHILGPLLGVRNRGKSDVRLGYLEEGKKRIE
ncbi:Phosphoinositide phosphatase sac1 [Elasticomyces elasticus]|nr:Phosphoinositide phosphatase sac1 [Elasticomyces elasticus]